MTVVEVIQGTSPVILSFPHTGTGVPGSIWDRLNDNGKLLADTDWHIQELYAGLLPHATTVRAAFHRYVIDANRDPDGVSLYPGQNTTGLVPETDFDGAPIWKRGDEPTDADIRKRLDRFHRPYHAALASEIERVKSIHGVAVLFDCHSIRSLIPFLFKGRLPDFNIGTDMGRTCHPHIETAASTIAAKAQGYTSIVNGRFKGGWTTRHYGKPEVGVHAIQMELAQISYLAAEAPFFGYEPQKAQRLRSHLRSMLHKIESVALDLEPKGNGDQESHQPILLDDDDDWWWYVTDVNAVPE